MINTFFEFCNYAVSNGFWIFFGCVILLGIPLNFTYQVLVKFFDHIVELKHGHKPEHDCKDDNDED